MKKENFQALSIEEIAHKHSLGDFELKTENAYLAKPDIVHYNRQKFMAGVRRVFLKYLPYIDTKAFYTLFSENQRNMIDMGNAPAQWNVHHQKPLAWGGQNFNPALRMAVYQTGLTKEQERKCKKSQLGKHLKEGFLLDNFLKNAQKKNRLKSTFLDLFKGYLILLPEGVHKALEEDFLQSQQLKAQQENETSSAKKVQKISYPVWDQIILWGRTFKLERTPRTISKSKDKVSKHTKQRHSRSRD